MVLQIRIINVPVSPFPVRSCHFIQEFTLCFVTKDDLSQALFSAGSLLPEFFLVSSLFTTKRKKISGFIILLPPTLEAVKITIRKYSPCVWSKGRSEAAWIFESLIWRSWSFPFSNFGMLDFGMAARSDWERLPTHCNHTKEHRVQSWQKTQGKLLRDLKCSV